MQGEAGFRRGGVSGPSPDSLIVGSPDNLPAPDALFAELCIDRLICFQQVGSLPPNKVMKSIRLWALIPNSKNPHHR